MHLREVINAIFAYPLLSVAQPRMMPHKFPAWKTVYDYFRLWRTAGVWQQMNQALREMLRRRAGRESTPLCSHRRRASQ